MVLRDPTFLGPHAPLPGGMVEHEEWFERKIGEFTLQTKLPCFRSETGEWFVTTDAWDAWDVELVTYFIRNGHKGPGVDAFIRAHALSSGQ